MAQSNKSQSHILECTLQSHTHTHTHERHMAEGRVEL